MLNHNKKEKGFSKVIVLILALVIIAGGVLAWQFWLEGIDDSEVANEQEPIVEQESPVVDETADWQTYRNEEYGFEVRYPTEPEFDKREAQRSFPPQHNKKYSGVEFIKELPDRKGCQFRDDNACNMSYGFFIIDQSFEDVSSEFDKYSSVVKNIKIDGRTSLVVNWGAEGIGMLYYYVALNERETLVINRWYLSEQINIQYREIDNFIVYNEQERIFNQILSTFKFYERQ